MVVSAVAVRALAFRIAVVAEMEGVAGAVLLGAILPSINACHAGQAVDISAVESVASAKTGAASGGKETSGRT